jgi:hypothetical protein
MRAPDPILEARRLLGPVQTHTLQAPTIVEAHRALGAWLQAPARSAIRRRLLATRPGALKLELASTRACRAFLEQRAESPRTPEEVRRALADYIECLDAWSRSAGLSACLTPPVAGVDQDVSDEDLGLWAQDDNTGCVTVMLRQAGGSVLVWHIEEDTIGYFDIPRIVSFALPGQTLSAFLYPYLLPGPAFGWGSGQLHAVDSLHLRRDGAPGAFTSVAAWLIWRLGRAVDARAIIRALSPFVDGCAINIAQVSGRVAQATTIELGGRYLASRRLRAAPGALSVQTNAVTRADSQFGRAEALRARERALYERRGLRAQALVERARAQGDEPAPQDIVAMLANRRGGSYALANRDVKAHCVARVSAAGIEVYVEAGSAHAGDLYRPGWHSP